MRRYEILNAIIQKKQVKNYLEIGVNKGRCLFKIKGGKLRIAVDPKFLFNTRKKLRNIISNVDNLKNKYFEVTSDEFFDTQKELLKDKPLDLAFIDGLHTYEQSYRDVINTLKHLKADGVIVMHDCNPGNKYSALPAENIFAAREILKNSPEATREWNGDVWKTIVQIRKNHPELTAFVLDTDYGLGFVIPKKNTEGLPEIFSAFESPDTLDYEFLEQHRKELLNLKPVNSFPEILNQL